MTTSRWRQAEIVAVVLLAWAALAAVSVAPLWPMGELQIARRLGRSPFPWP